MKIAVDAMGGDNAPAAVIEGAVQACREFGYEIILTGREELIRPTLSRLGATDASITVRHATQVVEMGDSPTEALKKKNDSSMRRAIEAVAKGEADAIVSAGNTGALLAKSLVYLRNIGGIDRPAITALIPNLKGFCIMLDVGANVDCKPQHLLQFGIMGNAFGKTVLNIDSPTVGLLNIGSEKTKGNKVTKTAFSMMEESSLNFVGNIEGTDVFRGVVDVVVCDGFAGNVALKITEGVAQVFADAFRKEKEGSIRSRLGMLLVRNGLRSLHSRLDYTEYGGAPFLGVNGVCIKAHGSSNAKAIKNAIRAAVQAREKDLVGRIREELHRNTEVETAEGVGSRIWKQLRDSINRGDDNPVP